MSLFLNQGEDGEIPGTATLPWRYTARAAKEKYCDCVKARSTIGARIENEKNRQTDPIYRHRRRKKTW